jgi:hypothetical protein
VEVQIGRFKHVIGDALRFPSDEAQAAKVLICILDLGRPTSVRIA